MDHRARAGEPPQDEGLHPWVLLVCLALAGVVCALLLSVTVRVMSQEPAAPPPITGRPAK